MLRSLCVILSVVLVSIGCSPDSAKQMADKASSGVKDAAKGAATSVGAGMSEVMGKAQETLSGVEGGSDMMKQVTELFGKATGVISGVTDADSATAALPDLTKLTEGFGGLSEKFGAMPEVAKSALSGVFKSSLSQLQPIIDKVLAIPGVDAILKPAIDALISKLGAFK